MALSKSDLSSICKLLGREPSTVEITIFDAMWSEHCSYKSTKRILKGLPTEASQVALGIGEDSGIVRFVEHDGKQYCLAVSHESHNHPSQILPVEGAATGVGGVVRDVYCMGADVIGVLNSLHFGINETGDEPLVDDIAKEVVQGVCDYANPLGVPVLGGETVFHPSYNQNCLVNVAAIGLLTEDEIIHSFVPEEAKQEKYVVILFGKSTDSTGFGGASFSSATLEKEDEVANMGAVQVHDPFIKRVLVEAMKALFNYIKEHQIKVGMKDLGAGGIACGTSEIAEPQGMGVALHLDKVNVVSSQLPPEVISCSETQERFVVAVPESHAEAVCNIFNKDYELPHIYPGAGAVVIGDVIDEPTYKIFHHGDVVCDLPISVITSDVSVFRDSEKKTVLRDGLNSVPMLSGDDLKSLCLSLLHSKNGNSKRYVYRFFDNAVRGDAVLYPGEADACVTAPIDGCQAGVAVSMDSNFYGFSDPYVAGAAAVAESIRNVVSVGAKPLCVTDCLNYGNPEKPAMFWDLEEGVRGIGDACRSLSFSLSEPLPIIAGNVSLYNEASTGESVIPSPVILTLGRVDDVSKVRSYQLETPELMLVLVGERYAEFGGTSVAACFDLANSCAPQVRFDDERKLNSAVYSCHQESLISACHDISEGGVFQAVSEMILGERGLVQVGAELQFSEKDKLFTSLFSENGGYVLAVASENLTRVQECCEKEGAAFKVIGYTTENKKLRVCYRDEEIFSLSTEVLDKAWNSQNLEQLAS